MRSDDFQWSVAVRRYTYTRYLILWHIIKIYCGGNVYVKTTYWFIFEHCRILYRYEHVSSLLLSHEKSRESVAAAAADEFALIIRAHMTVQ